MEQKQEQLLSEWGQLAKLDAAAQAVSAILTANERKYGFFGGYAVSLLGGSRMTNDVDVILGEDPQSVRELLLQDERFAVTAGNKLKFKLGGADQPLKLPDANSVPIVWVNPSRTNSDRVDCEVPVIHPVPLVLTKIKRWMFIAESTRPASRIKAHNDLDDIKTLLQQMVDNKMTMDFSLYPEKAKEDLLPGVRKLLALGYADVADMLQKTLTPGDFQAIQ